MAEVKINVQAALDGLERMKGPAQESLVRRMLVTGGSIIRDEAILRAPTGPRNHAPSSGREGHETWGTIKDSLYLYYDEERSNATNFRYTVSWNRKTSPQGQWVEFGHQFKYVLWKDADGNYHSDKRRPLANPIKVAPSPFLAPAFDTKLAEAHKAMIDRGRKEFPNLMAGKVDDDL